MHPFFLGAMLVALGKRCVAGCSLQRLAAKFVSCLVVDEMAELSVQHNWVMDGVREPGC